MDPVFVILHFNTNFEISSVTWCQVDYMPKKPEQVYEGLTCDG